MKALIAAVIVGGLVAVAFAGPPTAWDIDDARRAVKIEIQMDKAGRVGEIEFHVDPDQVPSAVRVAMDNLHPGGPYVGAEKEREDGVLYYELTREVDGLEMEAMFHPDGKLHSEEIQVAVDKVPVAVQAAIAEVYSDAKVSKWEEIRDGNRALIEYHVKLESGGRKYKAVVTTGGVFVEAFHEILAEVEVPAAPIR